MTRHPPGIERVGRQWEAWVLTLDEDFVSLGRYPTIKAAHDAQHAFWQARQAKEPRRTARRQQGSKQARQGR